MRSPPIARRIVTPGASSTDVGANINAARRNPIANLRISKVKESLIFERQSATHGLVCCQTTGI